MKKTIVLFHIQLDTVILICKNGNNKAFIDLAKELDNDVETLEDAKSVFDDNINLTYREYDITTSDIFVVIKSLGGETTTDLIEYIFKNYSEEDDPTSNWSEIIESLYYNYKDTVVENG